MLTIPLSNGTSISLLRNEPKHRASAPVDSPSQIQHSGTIVRGECWNSGDCVACRPGAHR